MLVLACVDVFLNVCRLVCVGIHACKYVHVHERTEVSSFLMNYPFSDCLLFGWFFRFVLFCFCMCEGL